MLKREPVTRPPASVEHSPDDIITRKVLLRRFKGAISNKKFAELEAKGLIPRMDLGHRTKRYREGAVRAALIALESEVGA